MDTIKDSIDKKVNFKNRDLIGFVVFYIVIVFSFLAISPRTFSSKWISSSDFHACIEISSSFIAIIAAIACLIYYFGLKNRYFLVIGLGFFVCGSEDFVHGLFSFERLFVDSGVDFSRFIPGTYVAGRIMLAITIITAVLLEKKLTPPNKIKKEALVYSALALLLGGGLTALAFSISLPGFIYPENIISRPVDLISAILFLVAFVLAFKRFVHVRDIFSGMLLACILLNFCGQIFMSFSKQLFDVFFDVAHWANILSYCMPVLGITIESLNKMKKAQEETIVRKKAEQELDASNKHLQTENSERRRAEKDLVSVNDILEGTIEKLAQSNVELQDFVYIASHDLREPLRKISSFGELLQDSLGEGLEEDDKENLDFMIDGAMRMTQMIEALLVYSRLNTNDITLSTVDLNEVIEQFSQLELATLLEETNATIDVPETLPTVRADETLIRQLIQNLIINGIKYQEPGGSPRIEITAREIDNGKVRIEFKDNGIGIKEEMHQAIFKMFKRVHSSKEYQGAGIGLAVCKKIAERHNSQIGVDSEQGEGSVFWFTMELAKEPATVS